MQIPKPIPDFLADDWQKRPLFMPTAIGRVEPVLPADELAWLATQADVESRLVFTERTGDRPRYRLEYGPFSESELSSLPERDWTLLVQDVEKHLPEFRAILAHTHFIPEWRIDDLMISLAAPGASVGPHSDNYDVFLCQATGHREWQLGEPEAARRDPDSNGLSLLLPYPACAVLTAGPGDVLYLPPGVPHWGVAADLCVTYSIGMRAPTRAELAAGARRIFGTPVDRELTESVQDAFYRDGDLQAEEADGCRIAPRTLARVREQALLDSSYRDEELAIVFGSVITDPKAWLMPAAPGTAAAAEFIDNTDEFRIHGMARVAWYESDDLRLLFVNGDARRMPPAAIGYVRQLCVDRAVPGAGLRRLQGEDGGSELLQWMVREGLFDVAADAE